jgi:hypothetical protein
MVGRKKTDPAPATDAPSLPAEVQPAGSGAVPGTEGAAEQTFGERMKATVVGEQVPGSVGYEPPELADDPDTDTELAEAAEEPMVVFQGEAGRREITAEQWQEAGVPGMPTVVWERRTGFKVPVSAFTPQALQVLRQDQGFRVP